MYLYSYYKNGRYYEEELDTKNSKVARQRSAILQARYAYGSIRDLTVRKIGEQLSFNSIDNKK